MIDYKLIQFASAPRTASTWFRKAAHVAGLGDGFAAHVHRPFALDSGKTLRVSLVRHPCAWLASYWAEILPGRVGVPEVDALPNDSACSDFDWFVETYLRTCPGQVGRIFAAYKADTYLRVEDLPWAAVELFESLGVRQDKLSAVAQLGPQNTSKVESLPIWDRRLKARVLEAEKAMLDQFDY